MSCSHHKLHPKHEDLQTYQAERVAEAELNRRVDEQCELYRSIAREVGLPDAPVRELRAGLIRAYVRADMLALRYQRRHLQFGGLVYLLAAAAVGVAAFQALFYFTMTPAPNFAGLRRSPIQQVYQWVRRVQHMTVLSET